MNPNNNKRAITMFFIYDVIPTPQEAAFAETLLGSVRFRNANYISDTDTPEKDITQVVSFGRIPLPYAEHTRIEVPAAPVATPVGNFAPQPEYQTQVQPQIVQQNFDAAGSQAQPDGQGFYNNGQNPAVNQNPAPQPFPVQNGDNGNNGWGNPQ